jgi:hypothetical protein
MDLISTELIDCTGQVTHKITLLFDGSIEIRFGAGLTARWHPETGVTDPPHVRIPEQVLAAARELSHM